ncbi:SANT/Myb_domain [Hexamita inflata]|uniref:SANT/Myb domain n=1 Tax=Hexamita inflata TaxID=28002 RepID=A0AA86N5B2_9EUKA|nr:SANT/Myb domain [Hexamita inflata]CAI9950002.1 SANT/Myb domain [Hexamita inflata]CAI9956747.1 SANT/Myb domain [Hexamita inflata]
MSQLVTKQMISNFSILQEIHRYTHEINRIKNKCNRIQRDRWSKAEDAILFDTVQIIGNRDCEAIAAVLISKNPSQVYQRLRYLREQGINQFHYCNEKCV